MSKSLRNACIGEFIGTGFILFFGAGCVAAAQVAGANFGLWEISIVWGLVFPWQSTFLPVFPVLTLTLRSL